MRFLGREWGWVTGLRTFCKQNFLFAIYANRIDKFDIEKMNIEKKNIFSESGLS